MSATQVSVSEFCTQLTASHVQKGSYVLLNGHPCKVTSVKLAQNGKHGGMKARITGKCVFTGAKQDNFFIGKELLQVPTVKKDVFQLSCIDEEEGIKYFNEDDEAIAFSLKQENKTVAFFLGENKEVTCLQEAYENDTECSLDFTITLLSSVVIISGKAYFVQILKEWKSSKAE